MGYVVKFPVEGRADVKVPTTLGHTPSAAEIRAARKALGWSQRELAHWLGGISVDTIRSWERSRRSPTGLYLIGVLSLLQFAAGRAEERRSA